MRALLLQLGHPEQIRTVLDLDCWHKDTLQSARVLEWLEALQHSGEAVCAQTLQTLDSEMLSVVLHRHIRVNAALPPPKRKWTLAPMMKCCPTNSIVSHLLIRTAP